MTQPKIKCLFFQRGIRKTTRICLMAKAEEDLGFPQQSNTNCEDTKARTRASLLSIEEGSTGRMFVISAGC